MSNAAAENGTLLMINDKWLTVGGKQWPVFSRQLSVPWRCLLFTFYFSLLTFLLPLTSCASVDPVVKIGLVAPFEGAERDLGYDAIYAARLAVRQMNAAGGVGGYRVALVALDDRGDVEMAEETAVSLTVDPAVVAVIGHGLPETTAVAKPVYAEANLPFLPLGEPPFSALDPAQLPADFTMAYNEVTPFDETAGPYAAATYDAMQLLFQAMARGEAETSEINRDSVTNGLTALKYDGLVGTVYQP